MHNDVKDYYGKVLQSSSDLKTDACCTDSELSADLKKTLSLIHPEVLSRYYGCGLVAPEVLSGTRILDLGCGTGRDCYTLAHLVGEHGEVVGVDMTDEQLAIALEYEEYHRQQFAYEKKNTRFLKGYIEKLDELNLEDESFDIIVSNCVINLSPDKPAVLREAMRLLKPGGELYFSDVYADRRVPKALIEDPVLYGECLSGALYWNDFLNLAKDAGFADPRLVEDRPLVIGNSDIERKIGHINFFSATYRLFKLDGLESHCEDYGQAVIYKGGIADCEEQFDLDKHHAIERGRVFPVCGNTWKMLHDTRFRDYFEFIGNQDTHYGIFEGCGSSLPFDRTVVSSGENSDDGCC